MDVVGTALLCRLCGTEVTEGKSVNIFDDSGDLLQKIRETLPISVSADDEGPRYICLSCHDQVILHYKFIQEILRHTRTADNKLQIKTLPDLPKESNDLSKVQSDGIYTCPNCNVELMFLLSNNSENCDYTFQISLAVDEPSDKNDISKETALERYHFNCVTDIKTQTSDIDVAPIIKSEQATFFKHEEENTEEHETGDHGTLPILEVCGNETSVSSQTINGNLCEQMEDCSKRLLESSSPSNSESTEKIAKLQIISYEAGNIDMDTDDKLEHTNGAIRWVNSETDNSSHRDIFIQEEDEIFEELEDSKLDDNDIIKSGPKIICELCGARYLSQLKYEFHMERHKLNKMDKYECTLCDKEASSENLLWDHYYHTHKSLLRFVCLECGKVFAKRSRLNGHQKSHNHSGVKEIHIDTHEANIDTNTDRIQKAIAIQVQGKVSVNCSFCGKLINDLDPDAINDLVTCPTCDDSTLSLVVDGNEAKVISPRQYHCSKCPKHFVRKERLEFHEMRHNENMNEFICSTCGKEFSAENSLYEHYLFVHKGARPHICELCGKSFQLKARLKEHHRSHTGEKPYQCDICGQRCRTTYALKIHRKIHFSNNRYTCNICNKSFSKKQNMNEHLEKHWKHDKSVSLPQLFKCPICFEDLPTYRMLKHHMMQTHNISNDDPILTKQKPWYECPQCHEKFKHQMSLKAHKERVHEGRVNPIYQCDACNATFRIKQLLVNHIKSKHDGEKRYKCAQCEKGFNDTKSLYNHVLLHTGKKPFVCEFCNTSFRRKDSRDHHRRKHTGEQPYQCPDCNECFSTYNNRSKHRKRVHGEGETECPECGEKCSGQQEIRIHLNKHLGEKLQRLENIDDV